jgi:hypothetical protein
MMRAASGDLSTRKRCRGAASYLVGSVASTGEVPEGLGAAGPESAQAPCVICPREPTVTVSVGRV